MMPNRQAANGQRAAQQNRIRIRAFPAAVDERYVTNTWDMLKQALMEILHKNNSGLSFEELYRNSYTMVLHKRGDLLYNGLREVLAGHLGTTIRDNVEESIGARFLDTLNKAWQDHITAMVMIRDILMYMDRVYVSQAGVEPVYNLGLRLFRTEVIDHEPINVHLKATLLNMIAMERRKEAIEWLDLKNAIQMLLALGFDSRRYYESQFEDLFLEETAEHYKRTAAKLLLENSASVYVQKVNECLEEECQRSERYLDKVTENKIFQVLKDTLIESNMRSVVGMNNSGMIFMLTNEKVDELRHMYELFKRVPDGVVVMADHMSQYLKQCGTALVEENNDTNAVQFIQNLIDLKDLFDRFLAHSFLLDPFFKQRIQADFVHFFNLSTKSPEYLSLYVDDKLRKGLRAVNDSDAEKVLDKAMVLFKYLNEKDMFERYYKQHLCRRLLLGKSVSDDTEKSMIAKLRTECGCQFTSKLEGMFKDMAVSDTINDEFRQHLTNAGLEQRVELSVSVLTKVYWPMTHSEPCELPASAHAAFDAFTAFYVQKHTGRKIALNPNAGSADVKAVFYGAAAMEEEAGPSSSTAATPGRKREHKILQVSTYQMVILMKFNERPRFTYRELRDATKISEREFRRNLLSMVMGKVGQRVLCRRGQGKELADDDVILVNDAFSSKLTRIKIQMVSGRGETEPERRETRDKVNDDRKHEIEAAIVRVMKARKRLLHNDLITEVTTQLKPRFMPDPTVIKKRIESLIEREYLKRDQTDLKVYHYMA